MNVFETIHLPAGNAICYSGYRQGQGSDLGIFPSYHQIKEDLLLLQGQWSYLRLYDCSQHAETVLEVIRNEKLDFKVMLGAYIIAEMNNFGCPWGGVYSKKQLEQNRIHNLEKIQNAIHLTNKYAAIVFAVSAGNEATADWTDHFVPVGHIIEYVEMLKIGTNKPITFCENYVPWHTKLESLTEKLDFISIHTYPVWEYKNIHEALAYTKNNYYGVAEKYPTLPVVITEAGWATNSNGRGINPDYVSEEFQEIYYHDLMHWSTQNNILTFVFEAFDEPWKGSADAMEPEKHWGLFYENRTPKKVMQPYFKPT
ncbi:MAG TPA: hypothetical protein PLS41_01310 [Bacteroidales bacterium]|nr:hypothetical protein [Bacteroidales bacterium]